MTRKMAASEHELKILNSSELKPVTLLWKPEVKAFPHDVMTFMILSGGDDNNLYHYTSTGAETGRIRSWRGGKWARKSGTSALIDQNIQGTSILKVFSSSSGLQTWRRVNSGFSQGDIMTSFWSSYCIRPQRNLFVSGSAVIFIHVTENVWSNSRWGRRRSVVGVVCEQLHTLVFGLFCPCCWSECSGGSGRSVRLKLIHFYADDDVFYDAAVRKNAVKTTTEKLWIRLQNML